MNLEGKRDYARKLRDEEVDKLRKKAYRRLKKELKGIRVWDMVKEIHDLSEWEFTLKKGWLVTETNDFGDRKVLITYLPKKYIGTAYEKYDKALWERATYECDEFAANQSVKWAGKFGKAQKKNKKLKKKIKELEKQ